MKRIIRLIFYIFLTDNIPRNPFLRLPNTFSLLSFRRVWLPQFVYLGTLYYSRIFSKLIVPHCSLGEFTFSLQIISSDPEWHSPLVN